MNRQLFIHHYLPSHLASALIAGSVLNFMLSDTVNYPISLQGPKDVRHKKFEHADIGLKGPIIVVIFAVLLFVMFAFMAPLTYGTPGYVFRCECGACHLPLCIASLGSR